jgi:predicted nucleotide-binding protein
VPAPLADLAALEATIVPDGALVAKTSLEALWSWELLARSKLAAAGGGSFSIVRTPEGIPFADYERAMTELHARLGGARRERRPSGKPTLFIGSSTEGRSIAEYLHDALKTGVECTAWYHGWFELSKANLENLEEAAKTFEYAALILTPDDVTTKRGIERPSPRDNVVFEIGFFMGALGRNRVFLVEHGGPLHLPSDLEGLARVQTELREDGNLAAAVNPACLRIREKIAGRRS